MKRGPIKSADLKRRVRRSRAMRRQNRAEYLRQMRERAEWGIALLKYLEVAGIPLVFRKADLIALRK